MKIVRLYSARKYIIRWAFVDARVAWGFIGAAAAAAWAVSTRDELVLKLAGVALQLAGVCIATFAVLAVGRLFELPALRQIVSAWWRRRPLATQYVVPSNAVGGSSVMSAAATRGPAKIDPSDSIGNQIATLSKNHAELFEMVGAAREQVNDVKNALTKSIQCEEQERAAQAERITKKIQQATASSPMAAVLGLFCIALGLILGTIPQELVCLCLRPK